MFESLLVANRGEVARRIFRTARELGVRTIAVHSDVDEGLPFVREADDAVCIGAAPARDSYLDAEAVLRAARDSGAAAVHPGYGFLAEDAGFAERVSDAGLTWVGPSPAAMRLMADKIQARITMSSGGLAVAAGTTEPVADSAAAVAAADEIGYPVMVKAAAGGGGIGMAAAADADEVRAAFTRVAANAERFFGSSRVLVERFVPRARHVEVQVLGLRDGRVVVLGSRDCSVQRRHQKIVEEAPAPRLARGLVDRMQAEAQAAVAALGYEGLGTVECLVDVERGEYVFLEMNTRLQVEHPITELTTGLDLVAEQLRVAAGDAPGFDPDRVATRGHALEFRICAEDPVKFLPSAGTITDWAMPVSDGVRVDAGYGTGDTVTPYYDSLLAKLCVWAPSREEAIDRAHEALRNCRVEGIRTNLPFFARLLQHDDFLSADYDTGVAAAVLDNLVPSGK